MVDKAISLALEYLYKLMFRNELSKKLTVILKNDNDNE